MKIIIPDTSLPLWAPAGSTLPGDTPSTSYTNLDMSAGGSKTSYGLLFSNPQGTPVVPINSSAIPVDMAALIAQYSVSITQPHSMYSPLATPYTSSTTIISPGVSGTVYMEPEQEEIEEWSADGWRFQVVTLETSPVPLAKSIMLAVANTGLPAATGTLVYNIFGTPPTLELQWQYQSLFFTTTAFGSPVIAVDLAKSLHPYPYTTYVCGIGKKGVCRHNPRWSFSATQKLTARRIHTIGQQNSVQRQF